MRSTSKGDVAMPTRPDLAAAEEFIFRSARLLDRHRCAFLFKGGSAEPVLQAIRAYRNEDGGFGHAIEPDLRTPTSQPTGVWAAFEVLDEIDRFYDPMVLEACDFLVTVSAADGGAPFVLPTAMTHPRGPWWQADATPTGSLVQTGGIAGLLHKHGVEHPWLGPATEFCWREAETMEETSPYQVRFLLPFLEHVPDRERAQAAFERIGPKLFEQGLVTLAPYAPGEVHLPLDYAPRPDSMARSLFSDEVIERNLDALSAAQDGEGAWNFNWAAWNPATTLEWRGFLTIAALKTLRAYRRID
jgi:hypothetical protein